jgi:hypothetical protein
MFMVLELQGNAMRGLLEWFDIQEVALLPPKNNVTMTNGIREMMLGMNVDAMHVICINRKGR